MRKIRYLSFLFFIFGDLSYVLSGNKKKKHINIIGNIYAQMEKAGAKRIHTLEEFYF